MLSLWRLINSVLIQTQKYEIEETDSKPSGDVVGEYGSKPNYFVKSALDLEMIWVEAGYFYDG